MGTRVLASVSSSFHALVPQESVSVCFSVGFESEWYIAIQNSPCLMIMFILN